MAHVIIFTGHNHSDISKAPSLHRTLGAYRVASSLINAGYTVKVIDYIQYLSADEIIKCIFKHIDETTLWVGYSSTFLDGSFNISKMMKVYSFIKHISNAKIVFGGGSVDFETFDPRVDYYVSGYSDNSIVALTDFISGKSHSLISKRINGSTLISSEDYPEPTMDNLKTDWAKFNVLEKEPLPLEFARGCIFKCKFCNYPLIGKRKNTYIRDMGEVRDELIELWETLGTDTFYITDDTFNDDNDKMEAFHKLFTSLPYKPKFASFLRLDLIDRYPHQIELLLDAGLVGAFFGIESFNLKSARVIGKGLHPEKVKRRLRDVKDKWGDNVGVGAGLIIGLPYDDDVYFKELETYITSTDYPIDNTAFNPLWIKDPSTGLGKYKSEFSINAEIYGYRFNADGNWFHENGLTFNKSRDIANHLSSIVEQKPSDFQVISLLGMGIKLDDILKLGYNKLYEKYDFASMNTQNLNRYKTMIGAL